MPKFELDLTDAELERLRALAKWRNRSPERCLKDFIAACMTGPSGYEPPEKAKPFESKKEKKEGG